MCSDVWNPNEDLCLYLEWNEMKELVIVNSDSDSDSVSGQYQ